MPSNDGQAVRHAHSSKLHSMGLRLAPFRKRVLQVMPDWYVHRRTTPLEHFNSRINDSAIGHRIRIVESQNSFNAVAASAQRPNVCGSIIRVISRPSICDPSARETVEDLSRGQSGRIWEIRVVKNS